MLWSKPWRTEATFAPGICPIRDDLAKRTLARHAYLDAEMLYKNALENVPDADDQAQIAASRGRGLMRFRLGRHEDASKDLQVALERARKVGAKIPQVDLLLDQVALAEGEVLPPAVEARLFMARGRSLYRADQLIPGTEWLQKAIAVGEPLGDDGYEAFSQSLMMVCFALTNLGKLDEAIATSQKIIRVAEEHNDALLLAGVLQNRGFLYFMLGRAEDLIADFRRCIQITREYGFAMFESLTTKDLGEVMFYLGRAEDSEPLAQRAAELYAMTQGDKSPRVAYSEVLLARVKAYRGDVEGARATVERITKMQAEIQAEGLDSALPADGKAQLDGVSLWLSGASDAEFDALIAHARAFPLQPQDVIEIMEFKALSALRTGRRADGVRLLEEAYADADKNAKIVTDRLRRQLDQAQALAAS